MKNIKELVKDNTVSFSFYRNNVLYYWLHTKDGIYEFPIPIEDLGNATVSHNEKAITVMRYIRKAIEDKTIYKKHITTETVG